MKVFFLKEDSLYKIFKTLQKLPKKKNVEIYIESQSPFFQHERRWVQIKELIEKEKIQVTFTTNNKKNKSYYKRLNLPIKYLQQKKITKILKLIYLFFFNIKKFHLQFHSSSNNYMFYMIFSFEIIVIWSILYLLYGLILPKTIIEIQPAYSNEEIIYNFRYYPNQLKNFPQTTNKITVPYYTWTLKLSHSSTLLLDEILFHETPATWTLRIVNTTSDTLPIIKTTQFITENWMIFRTTHFVTIPAATNKWPGIVYVNVKADKYDINSRLIWIKWNIKKDTKLYIRNLKQSFYKKEIYADVLFDLEWWDTIRQANIQTWDILDLKSKLNQHIEKNKLSIIKNDIQKDNNILIPFKSLIMDNNNFFDYNIPQTQTTWAMISWKLEKEYIYFYVKEKDLINSFKKFLNERAWNVMDIVSFNNYSITFLDNISHSWSNIIIAPTKINVIRWYDFNKDINGILANIKDKIIWKPLKGKDNAYNYILSFKEIWNIKITVTPPRYNAISKLKSRIYFKINKIK